MTPTLISKMDLRGLEPPEPMMRILEALATTPPGIILEAHLERRPMFLLEELKRRGQQHTCTPQADGSWTIQMPITETSATGSPST
ncbi:MAG: DUF2249 domain-containing protein [Nibricoccus sp.]